MPEHIAKNIKKLELLLELAEQLTEAQLDNVLLYTHAFIDGVNYDPAKRGE